MRNTKIWLHRLRFIFSILGAVAFSIHSAQCNSSTVLSWLNDADLVVLTKPSWRELLVADIRDNAMLVCAPDDTQFAYCVSGANESTAKLFSISPEHKREISLFSGQGTTARAILPLDIVWSPDSDRIFVQFGFADSTTSGWFPYDAKDGKFLGDKDQFERLQKINNRERSETHNFHPNDSSPVWTLGGKEFPSEIEARKAGFSRFFSRAAYQQQPDLGGFVIFGEQWDLYYVLQGVSNSTWTAYVFRNGNLVDKIGLAGPVHQKAFFVYKDNELLLKVAWHAYPKGANVLIHSNSNFRALTVSLGKCHLESITDLKASGLIIQTSDAKTRKWRLLDIGKLCAGNSFEGVSDAFIER